MQEQSQSTFQPLPTDKIIDDVFVVRESRFGLFHTITLKGRRMLTGATEEAVITMTRWHLKCEQEGTLQDYTRVLSIGSDYRL